MILKLLNEQISAKYAPWIPFVRKICYNEGYSERILPERDWNMHALILASASPRRRELLTNMGIPFTIHPSDADETVSGAPEEMVRTLALRKAAQVAQAVGAGWIVGADTLVALDGRALGKPSDADDAVHMLKALSGRAHDVFTGVCLMDAATGKRDLRVVGTKVFFRPLIEEEIRAYVATGEPMDKAGAYAIQGGARGFVERYEGSYENIVGFPTQEFAKMYEGFEGLLK